MEPVGLTLGLLPLLFKLVNSNERLLLVDYRSAGDRFDILRIQLLTQRARMKYVIECVQSGDFSPDLQVWSLMKVCLEAIHGEFIKLDKIEEDYVIPQANSSSTPRVARFSNAQKIRWAIRDRERMQISLTEITVLIDNVEALIRQPKDFDFRAEASQPSQVRRKGKGKEQRTFSSMPEKGSGLQEGNIIEAQDAEILFHSLVFLCEQALKMVSSYSEALKEIFLSYLLWARTLKSENVFAIFTPSPAQIDDQQGPDLLKTHYELLAQVAWTLIQSSEAFNLESQLSGQEMLSQLHIILSKVQDAGVENYLNDFLDSGEGYGDFKAVQTFAADELQILVDSLLNSLPSLLHRSQSQQVKAPSRVRIAVPHSVEAKEEQPSSIKELLEVAVQLTADISEAFDEMSKDKQSLGKISIEESLRDLYNREVTALLKWKEANGSKLGGKVTPQNQEVWEALQATLFNMTDLINSMSSQAKATNAADSTLNAKADKLLADYSRMHTQVDLSSKPNQDQDINDMIRDLSEFVQTLLNMEVPLGLIESPPMYEERFGDQIILNVEGQLA